MPHPTKEKEQFNKKDIGARIKRLRKEAGLRQWQLAELVGATQPAIHMYERGVLPEPKRLLEIARIGGTTVEWILTGRHWQDGSEEMRRVPDEVYGLAFKLKDTSDEERIALGEAMRVIESAVHAVEGSGGEIGNMTVEEIARQLRGFSEDSRRALTASLRIHEAVCKTVMAEGAERLNRRVSTNGGAPTADLMMEDGTNGKGDFMSFKPNSIEAIRGNVYKLDSSLLVINDILKDKDLRAEFAASVARIHSKLESKRSKAGKQKSRRRK